MAYALRFRPPADREFADLPEPTRTVMGRKLLLLCEDPHQPDAGVPLSGVLRGYYTAGLGAYRVAYSIDDEAREVVVEMAGHRNEFYPDLRRRVRRRRR